MKPDLNQITVIVPVFNEEKAIGGVIGGLLENLPRDQWDIIVVDDGSTDESARKIAEFKEIHLLSHNKNRGYGAALKTGIKNAETPLVAFFDADGQHKIEDLIRLSEIMDENDMVVGKRDRDSHKDWIRFPGKWILSKVANFLVGEKIPDINSGLRIIKTEEIKRILPILPNTFSFSTTSTLAFTYLGFSVFYHPISTRKRIGVSNVRQIRDGTNTIMLMLKLIMLFNPFRVFGPLSVLLVSLGLVYEVIYGIILIEGVKLLPGALLLILTGVLTFLFGLLADQISEMRRQNIVKYE